jgi:hypothetical protein
MGLISMVKSRGFLENILYGSRPLFICNKAINELKKSKNI